MRIVRCDEVLGAFTVRADTTDDAVVSEVWEERVYVEHPEVLAGRRVLDLGANIGAFTVLAAAAGAEVVAYEPDAANFMAWRRHVEINNLAERVAGHQAAVLDFAGSALLDGSAGTAHVAGTGEPVAVSSIGDVIDQDGPFDFVKMDVEGSEWSLLPALLRRNMAGVGEMVLEHHGPTMGGRAASEGDVERHLAFVAPLLAGLAELGHLDVLGRLSVGGTIRWRPYQPTEGA